jgi:hypothetical protein
LSLSKDRIEQITSDLHTYKSAKENASPGEYTRGKGRYVTAVVNGRSEDVGAFGDTIFSARPIDERNAEFLVVSKNTPLERHLADLLAEVDRLRGQLEAKLEAKPDARAPKSQNRPA